VCADFGGDSPGSDYRPQEIDRRCDGTSMPDLRQLKYFVTLARQLHFGRAAQELDIAQPSLTQTIQQLERALGVALFERTSRSVKLTASGTVFYHEALQVLNQLEFACHAAQNATRVQPDRLAIGFVTTSIISTLSPLIQLYHESYPAVRLMLREMLVDELVELLHLGEFDLICTDGDVIDSDFESLSMPSPPWVLAVHRTSPLARRFSLALHEAAEQPFVLATDYPVHNLSRKMLDTCRSLQFTPDIEGYADSVPSALAMVEAKLGVAMVYHLPRYRPADVLLKKIEGRNMDQRMQLSWRRDNLTPAAADFLRLSRESQWGRGRRAERPVA
jgi:DNA-binding transcriptional LysR family regulator